MQDLICRRGSSICQWTSGAVVIAEYDIIILRLLYDFPAHLRGSKGLRIPLHMYFAYVCMMRHMVCI